MTISQYCETLDLPHAMAFMNILHILCGFQWPLAWQVAAALLAAKQREDAPGWQAFQERVHALKNQRTRARREAEDLQASIFAADTAQRLQREGALTGVALSAVHQLFLQTKLFVEEQTRVLQRNSAVR